MTQVYGDISPRTAAFAVKEMLIRAMPYLVLEKFAQCKKHDRNNLKLLKFRRFEKLPILTVPLQEGVTPTSQQVSVTDVELTLTQFGGFTEISDVIIDTHEDPVLMENSAVLGQQAAETVETFRYGIFRAGTNVVYSNGVLRTDVNTPISVTAIRKAVRALKRQDAKPITKVIKSTPSWGTENVRAAYVGLIHPDLEADLRALGDAFTPSEKYGTLSAWDNEIGKVDEVRFVSSTIFAPFLDAGGVAGVDVLASEGANADVYPILILGTDAIACSALKGQDSLTPTVVNPKPSDSDPLAQRGKVGWKTMQGAVILNDLFMVRLEVAAGALE